MPKPYSFAKVHDKIAYEQVPFTDRLPACHTYQMLVETAKAFPDKSALSFQMFGKAKTKSVTLCWRDVLEQVNQIANTLYKLGVSHSSPVALVLPNCPEMAVCLLAGQITGSVVPINPMLSAQAIADLLHQTNVKTVISLAPFVQSDLAEKVRAAASIAQVTTLLEVDLKKYLAFPMSLISTVVRPRTPKPVSVEVVDFAKVIQSAQKDSLSFTPDVHKESIAAYFHTGGTTGAPKIVPHTHQGIMFNTIIAHDFLIEPDDVVLCPLPLFHVLAAYPIWFTCVASGAHLVLPTPKGYRGKGVIDNFWQLCARWQVTFICAVPTALSTLLRHPVDTDTTNIKFALCGSAPMSQDTFKAFEQKTGIKILEGYGQTETTCLISCNPPDAQRKIGSVGLSFPYTDVRIVEIDNMSIKRDCEVECTGEIIVKGPQVINGYCDTYHNTGLFVDNYILTGDRGYLDSDGYLWITGRTKDLIIRGGHNIDPRTIEEAFIQHPDIADACAVGQPDTHAGEVPCVYIELKPGTNTNEVTPEDLKVFSQKNIRERPARPAHIEIISELPRTTVGKIYKPDIRKMAIKRVFEQVLLQHNLDCQVSVEENKKSGMIVKITDVGNVTEVQVHNALSKFSQQWYFTKK